MFPKSIAAVIAGYCAKIYRKDWVKKNKLDIIALLSNPIAWKTNMAGINKLDLSSYIQLLSNASTKDHILTNIKKVYPYLLLRDDILESYFMTLIDGEKYPKFIWSSTDPIIFQYAEQNFEKDWTLISSNPIAIEMIRANSYRIDRNSICANPAAIDIIQELYPDYLYFSESAYKYLAQNPHPWAIKQMNKLRDPYKYTDFAKNTTLFCYCINPKLIAALTG